MREGVTNRGGVAGEGAAAVARTPVKTFQAYLPPAHRTYSCIHCRAHLASHDELISKVSRITSRLLLYQLPYIYISVVFSFGALILYVSDIDMDSDDHSVIFRSLFVIFSH